jgi:hypothetical protein
MDSETGRFISEDPANDQKNPNLYTYCRNNPLTVTDPTGKWSQNKNGDWVCDNKKDTLWSLSDKVYGEGSQWELLNFGRDPGKLQIGDILNSKKFGIANTSIGAQTPADKFRNTASKVIKYIPGVNIVNDAYGAVTGQDLTGNLLLTEKEKFDAKFSTFINVGTLGAGAYLASLEKSAALSLGEIAATSVDNAATQGSLTRFGELRNGINVLKDAGYSIGQRREILEAFVPGTIKSEIAGDSTYGLRLYGGLSGSRSSWLSETFPLGNARELLAPSPGNALNQISQWQINPGTEFLSGKVAPNFGMPGGGNQWFVPNPEVNLLQW